MRNINSDEDEGTPMIHGLSAPPREPNGRDLYITGEITDGMINTVVLPIMKFNKEDEKYKVREPINIYIHSPGGNTWVSLAIVDAIMNSETPVNTICLGYAASGAFYIMCAGHRRKALKNSSLMLHTASWGTWGKVPQMKSNIVELDNTEKKLITLLEQKTMINEKDFRSMSSHEWWMTTEEALEYQVIDEVIGVKKDVQT